MIISKVAFFEKVSFNEFRKTLDCINTYEGISLPKRATNGSAGYDFYLPYAINLKPNETAVISTGIRCKIQPGWVLTIYPRSSLGFKYRMQLDNTVAIIDSDYYYALNEGHIFIKISNLSLDNKVLELPALTRFAQGIFLPYGITVDDECSEIRTGGLGSTDNKK